MKFETEITSFEELNLCVGHEVRFAISGDAGGIVKKDTPDSFVLESLDGKHRNDYRVTAGMFDRGLRLYTLKEKLGVK